MLTTRQVNDLIKKLPRKGYPDMPDRILAATARVWRVPLGTAETDIAESKLVQVIW